MTKKQFFEYCAKCNTYRTKKYIVAQRIGWVTDNENGNYTFGIDYRFRRTPALDKAYDEFFSTRRDREGKRLRMDESIVQDMSVIILNT